MAGIRTLEISILYYANVIHGTKRDAFNSQYNFYISHLSNIPAHLHHQTVNESDADAPSKLNASDPV